MLSHGHCPWLLFVRMSGEQREAEGCRDVTHVTLCHDACHLCHGWDGEANSRARDPAGRDVTGLCGLYVR